MGNGFVVGYGIVNATAPAAGATLLTITGIYGLAIRIVSIHGAVTPAGTVDLRVWDGSIGGTELGRTLITTVQGTPLRDPEGIFDESVPGELLGTPPVETAHDVILETENAPGVGNKVQLQVRWEFIPLESSRKAIVVTP